MDPITSPPGYRVVVDVISGGRDGVVQASTLCEDVDDVNNNMNSRARIHDDVTTVIIDAVIARPTGLVGSRCISESAPKSGDLSY